MNYHDNYWGNKDQAKMVDNYLELQSSKYLYYREVSNPKPVHKTRYKRGHDVSVYIAEFASEELSGEYCNFKNISLNDDRYSI